MSLHTGKNLHLHSRLLAFGLVSSMAIWLGQLSVETTNAQVIVHLPQYSEFRINSSFFVPDGGSLYHGGVGRSSMGYNSTGIPMLGHVPVLGNLGRNRGIGYSSSSTGVVTTARVYNMRDIGDGILNGTHDSYGNRISNVPYRGSATPSVSQSWPGDKSQGERSRREFNTAFSPEASSRTAAGVPQLSPEQVKQRAQFLKANLGRNR